MATGLSFEVPHQRKMIFFEAVTPVFTAPAVFLVLVATIVLVGLRLWVKVMSIGISQRVYWQLTATVIGFIGLFVVVVAFRFFAYG